jgi:N-acetyl-gamma-glutamyl-phosphate reductase
MKKIRIGIVGVSGYAGLELIKLVIRHPAAKMVAAMDAAEVGELPLAEIHPQLQGMSELKTFAPEESRLAELKLDTVFFCTPDKVSVDLAPRFLSLGVRVVDLSGAFRLKDEEAYPPWYGFHHPNPELLQKAVYGLAEWNAADIASADLVANPGCYPTSVTLALLPLARAAMIEAGSDIVCDSKSGVTGAGRGVKQALMFAEVEESFRPYSPIKHRHAPEMCQEIGWDLSSFLFVPHLLPINRGIISTMYVHFHNQVSSAQIEAEYKKRYSGHTFVRILGSSRIPELRDVNHTNFCDIGWRLTSGGRRGVIFSAVDNLVKGASGQALQNFNLMHGLKESEGLL